MESPLLHSVLSFKPEESLFGREAKNIERERLNLTGDMLANVINASAAIRAMDLQERKAIGDSSDDHLGIVHGSGWHDGFKADLYTKCCLLVSSKVFSFARWFCCLFLTLESRHNRASCIMHYAHSV